MIRPPRSVRVRAFAKINLTLRVLGSEGDGYHQVRTAFQSLGLHDTLTFTPARGRWSIECDEPRCPSDRTNLVWRAGESLWREAGRRGSPSGVHVHIRKRIPVEAGLGGGSSDAAAALRALTHLWRLRLSHDRLHAISRSLGADVPFFLQGGTALGLERGDLLFPLVDWPGSWVVLVVPEIGVRTADAYRWWDEGLGRQPARSRSAEMGLLPPSELTNDLQGPVTARHPEIARLARRLRHRGAYCSMMSGSGSAVFGLFARERAARSAATALPGCRATLVTRTLTRRQFERASRPYLAAPRSVDREVGKS